MSTLNVLLRSACTNYRDKVAFVQATDGSQISFGQFWAEVNDLAWQISRHFAGSGPIAVLGHNSLDWIRWETAISLSGRACLPTNFRLSSDEIAWQLRHARASGLVYGPEFADITDELTAEGFTCMPFATQPNGPASGSVLSGLSVDATPETVQRIMYTSATTGVPKGVLTPHGRIVDNVISTLANQLHDADADSRYLVATPLTHMAIGYLWPIMAVGGTSVILENFSARGFVDNVLEHSITHTLLVPTMVGMITDLLEAESETQQTMKQSSLRAVWYAGAAMTTGELKRARRIFGPILNQQYGLTELWTSHRSMCATMVRAGTGDDRPGTCGRPLVGTELAILDESLKPLGPGERGELAIRSSGVVLGYLDNPAATSETFVDSWTLSGDIAYQDEDGFVYIVDRKKDMIISGGLNIYSAELENVLSTHPGVHQCAAVAVPDPIWGETPWVFVVTYSAPVSSEELIGFLRERLGRYKTPSKIVFVDELPLGPTGKILKRRLREDAERRLSDDSAQV